MARPKKYADRVATAVRLPVDLHQQLQEVADERDVSVNYLIVRGVSQYLEQLAPVEESPKLRPTSI
jgi:predicted transcriptional regulator